MSNIGYFISPFLQPPRKEQFFILSLHIFFPPKVNKLVVIPRPPWLDARLWIERSLQYPWLPWAGASLLVVVLTWWHENNGNTNKAAGRDSLCSFINITCLLAIFQTIIFISLFSGRAWLHRLTVCVRSNRLLYIKRHRQYVNGNVMNHLNVFSETCRSLKENKRKCETGEGWWHPACVRTDTL